jgi:predicted nuclease with TOPRIM domain
MLEMLLIYNSEIYFMFDQLLQIIHYIDQDRIIDAASKLLEIVKDKDDEELMKIAAELEKEIKELREEKSILEVVSPSYATEFKHLLEEMENVRKRKIKLLSMELINRLGGNNYLVKELLTQRRVEVRPHTFI